MDSPLNRAHQQERKAENLLSSNDYSSAITCYELAAGHITEAMKQTSATQALISMKLQHEDHIRKQRMLKEKIHSLKQTANQNEVNNKNVSDWKTKDLQKDPALDNEKVEIETDLKESVKSDISLTSSLSNSSQTQNTDENKPNSTTQDLQMQVLSLTQALEDCNRENNHLRSIILKFKKVLESKFGLSVEQIEGIIVGQDSLGNIDNKL